MDDKKPSWKQFQNLRFDSKKFSKRARKAEGVTTRHARKFIVRRLNNMRDAKRHIVLWLVVVGCLIVSAGVQLIWFQRSYTALAPNDGGTYAEGLVGSIETLNPLYASTAAELAVSKLMYSSLYNYDKTGHLREDVATSITPDKSGTSYIVRLNPAVRWHDGAKLTAEDVAFTIKLIKDPQSHSRLQTTWQDVDVKVINDETVRFSLPSPYASFPHALTFSILPKHILGSVPAGAIRESTFSLNPVGSGPFEFRLLQTVSKSAPLHEIVSLKASDRFYRGTPKLNRFEIHAYDTADAVTRALRTGQINAAVDAADIKNLKDNPQFEASTHPLNNGVYALLNTSQPVLKDERVRRALQLSTDTEAIRKQFALTPPALDLPFVRGQIDDEMPKAPAYNLSKAAQILDKAGWKLVDGTRTKKKQPLTLSVMTTKNNDYEKTLEQLAGQWRKLGIDVQTTVIDTDDPSQNFVQNVLQPRSFDVLIYELTIGADPDVFAYWHSSQRGKNELNFSNYSSGLSDDALLSARSRSEPLLRDLKYKTFAKQWLEDVPAIGLYQSTMTYARSTNVESLKDGQKFVSATDRYADILYWSVGQTSVYNSP